MHLSDTVRVLIIASTVMGNMFKTSSNVVGSGRCRQFCRLNNPDSVDRVTPSHMPCTGTEIITC